MNYRVEHFVKRAKSCLSNFMTFADFVDFAGYSDLFAVQNKDLFSEEEYVAYDRISLDLEIITALMLDNYDTKSVKECTELWENTFKKEAEEVISESITLVINSENAFVVQRGKCIDDNRTEYEFKIIKRRTLNETGGYENSPGIQVVQTPECYDVFYENPSKKGDFTVSGGAFSSLEEALVSVGMNPCFYEWI